MRWSQLIRFMIKPDRRERVSGDRNHSVASGALAIARPNWEQNHCAESWRGVIHGALLLLFLVLGVFVWMRWNFSARPITDWQPVLALADAAVERGNLYYAKSLYLQAGKLSAGRDDWAGLLAAACGMKKLERQRGRRSETTALLLNAMAAAKAQQSRSGLAAVAQAFTALGQHQVAAIVLSQSGQDWVEETSNPANGISLDCWQRPD